MSSRWTYVPGSNVGIAAAASERRSSPAARLHGPLNMVRFAGPNKAYAPEHNLTVEELDEVLREELEGITSQDPDGPSGRMELIARQLQPRSPQYAIKTVPAQQQSPRRTYLRPWR
ncbi:hypothetical protein PLESTF_001720200 [Pleodorina starrii]|nr:hypothetical protein PLESTF_001720200 [Pleodorina starrii]